jgi:hypothetical protein
MNLLRELPAGPDIPNVIYVVVEVPKGSRNKYEYDKNAGFVKLDCSGLTSPDRRRRAWRLCQASTG